MGITTIAKNASVCFNIYMNNKYNLSQRISTVILLSVGFYSAKINNADWRSWAVMCFASWVSSLVFQKYYEDKKK